MPIAQYIQHLLQKINFSNAMNTFTILSWFNWLLMVLYTARLFKPLKLEERWKGVSIINNFVVIITLIVLGVYVFITVPKHKKHTVIVLTVLVLVPMYVGFIIYAAIFEIKKQQITFATQKNELIKFYLAFLALNSVATTILFFVSFIFYWNTLYNIINVVLIIVVSLFFLAKYWLRIELTDIKFWKIHY